MADIKSCEGVYIFECVKCKGEFHSKNKNSTDGMSCPKCKGYLNPKSFEKCKDENEIVAHAKYECLSCEHTGLVRGKRKEYQEVLLCPKCKGLFIDIWKIKKYDHLRKSKKRFGELTVDIDVSDALKGLKAVQREAKKAAQALKEVEELKSRI